MTINLRETIRARLNATHEADPGVIAEKVIADIDSDDLLEALRQTMRPFVRQTILETRNSHRQGAHMSLTERAESTRTKSARPAPVSWRAKLIRDDFEHQLEQLLDDPFHVGKSEWKLLRNCTAENLRAMSDERQEKAEQNAAWARTFHAYAEAVETAGVNTFGELDRATLTRLLDPNSGEAA